MKKLLKLLPVLSLLLFGVHFVNAQISTVSPIKNVAAHEAKKVVESGDFVVVDIRTPKEFSQGHIKGAINIDFYNESFMDNLSKLDRNKGYFVYCRSGNRSGKSMKMFNSLGFKNIVHLQRGIIDWKASGYELVQ